MIKSNSKAAKAAIRQWIIDNYNPEFASVYPVAENDLKQIAISVLSKFERQAYSVPNEWRQNRQTAFVDWMNALPGILDPGFLYWKTGKNSVMLIAEWLQETEEQSEKYDQRSADIFALSLIYRELCAAERSK